MATRSWNRETDWLHYLFQPEQALPFDACRPLQAVEASVYVDDGQAEPDPDAIAMSAPRHYRKAVFFKYVKNLIDQGDACYRELSRDGLAEAKQWYRQAIALLGERPDPRLSRSWKSGKLADKLEQDIQARRNSKDPIVVHLRCQKHDNEPNPHRNRLFLP